MSKIRILIVCLLFTLFGGQLFSQNLDIRLLREINSRESLPSDGFFRFMSDSHGYFAAAVPLTLGVSGFVKHNNETKWNALEMVASIAIDQAVVQGMKYAINRDRPFSVYSDITQKIDVNDPSFPSGHSSVAFATATSISLEYPKWYIIIPSYAWAGTVAYSRLHLGVHYPSDVLAGALIGSGSAWITHFFSMKLNGSITKNRQSR